MGQIMQEPQAPRLDGCKPQTVLTLLPLCVSAQHAYIFRAACVIVVLISADRNKVHNAKDWTLTYPYYKEPWQHNLGSSLEL